MHIGSTRGKGMNSSPSYNKYINHNGIVRDLRQKKVLVGFWLAKLE